MRINGEGHTHLSDGELHAIKGNQPRVSIKHLNLSLVREVNLGLIRHPGSHLSRQTEARCTHLEAALLVIGLVFKFTTNGSFYFGLVVHIVTLLSLNDD